MLIKDPKDNKKSVSLTLLLLSFMFISTMGALQCFEKIKDTGPFMELYITSVSLYFGRRFDVSKFINKKKEKEIE